MIIRCDNCNKEFNKWKSSIKRTKNHFCSKKCEAIYRRDNLTHKVFGELEVLELDYIEKGQSFYKCKCSCGRIISVRSGYLKTRQNSCNNCKGRRYVGKISGKYFYRTRKRAERDNIDFDITKEYIWNIYLQQDGKCVYSGLDITFGNTGKEEENGETTASLDRIDSSKGYIEGNVQWVHKDINTMKNKFDEKYFIEICHLISQKAKEKINQ